MKWRVRFVRTAINYFVKINGVFYFFWVQMMEIQPTLHDDISDRVFNELHVKHIVQRIIDIDGLILQGMWCQRYNHFNYSSRTKLPPQINGLLIKYFFK